MTPIIKVIPIQTISILLMQLPSFLHEIYFSLRKSLHVLQKTTQRFHRAEYPYVMVCQQRLQNSLCLCTCMHIYTCIQVNNCEFKPWTLKVVLVSFVMPAWLSYQSKTNQSMKSPNKYPLPH